MTNSTTLTKTRTRHNYQLGRRLIHMSSGVIYVALYQTMLDQQLIIKLVAVISLLWYCIDRTRVKYPRLIAQFPFLRTWFFRDEEATKESAAVAYQFATLITLIIFPKPIACAAILTLALADPASAFVGIGLGRHKFPRLHKSLEGSLAYFVTCLTIFWLLSGDSALQSAFPSTKLLAYCLIVSLLSTILELLPLPVDDNFSIPIGTGVIATIIGFLTI